MGQRMQSDRGVRVQVSQQADAVHAEQGVVGGAGVAPLHAGHVGRRAGLRAAEEDAACGRKSTSTCTPCAWLSEALRHSEVRARASSRGCRAAPEGVAPRESRELRGMLNLTQPDEVLSTGESW